MTAAERQRRTDEADRLCAEAYAGCGGPDTGMALVAVGGYGRRELAPYSDLDVVLVHADGVDPGPLAEQVWYPLWDGAARLDHAVRSLDQMVAAAARRPQGRARAARPAPPRRRPEPHPAPAHDRADGLAPRRPRPAARAARAGALASRPAGRAGAPLGPGPQGGRGRPARRDRAQGAGRELAGRRRRTSTSSAAGRRCSTSATCCRAWPGVATDRIAPEVWDDLADGLGLARRRGRAAPRARARPPDRAPLAPDLATGRRRRLPSRTTGPATPGAGAGGAGRGALARRGGARRQRAPRGRAAAPARGGRGRRRARRRAGAGHGARLVHDGASLPEPWPPQARQLLVRLLASGRGLLGVWETLDETGALHHLLPEWERIRLLPHASPIHRFTVDRHVVETCIEASALIRHVARPDVLMVAALLHDIGKGGLTAHSVEGEPIARRIAERTGFDPSAVDLVGRAGALAPAARRDRDHPRPRRPRDRGRRRGAARRPGGPRPAGRADRGRRPGDLRQGVVDAGAPAWSATLGRRVAAAFAGSSATAPEVEPDEVPVPTHRAPRRRRARRGAGRRRVDGDRRGARPGRPARRRGRRLRAAARLGARGPRLEPGGVRRVGVGRRGDPPRPRGPAAAVRGDRRRTASTPRPGCVPPTPGCSRPPSSSAPRPRTTRPCSRSAPPTAPVSSTSSAPRSPAST